jgi:hypothetical protein
VEEVARKGKGRITNGNGFGVKLGLKNSKVRSSEIEVVVHVNKNGTSLSGKLLVHELVNHISLRLWGFRP